MEQARRHAQHRSGTASSNHNAGTDPNTSTPTTEGANASRARLRPIHSDDHSMMAPLTRVLPERLVERTREKQSQRSHYRKRNDLKLAFSEFYLMLVLLQNYQTLNFTGFRKILKKHDKLFQTSRGEDWR